MLLTAELGQDRTLTHRSKQHPLFDHLVGSREHCRQNAETKNLASSNGKSTGLSARAPERAGSATPQSWIRSRLLKGL
jgi:hypothetical protein